MKFYALIFLIFLSSCLTTKHDEKKNKKSPSKEQKERGKSKSKKNSLLGVKLRLNDGTEVWKLANEVFPNNSIILKINDDHESLENGNKENFEIIKNYLLDKMVKLTSSIVKNKDLSNAKTKEKLFEISKSFYDLVHKLSESEETHLKVSYLMFHFSVWGQGEGRVCQQTNKGLNTQNSNTLEKQIEAQVLGEAWEDLWNQIDNPIWENAWQAVWDYTHNSTILKNKNIFSDIRDAHIQSTIDFIFLVYMYENIVNMYSSEFQSVISEIQRTISIKDAEKLINKIMIPKDKGKFLFNSYLKFIGRNRTPANITT